MSVLSLGEGLIHSNWNFWKIFDKARKGKILKSTGMNILSEKVLLFEIIISQLYGSTTVVMAMYGLH